MDAKSDEAGFSTRLEYIGHLLFYRPDISQIATAEDASTTTDSTPVDEIDQPVDELANHHDELTQRVSDLEEKVEQFHLNDDQPTDSSPSVSSTETILFRIIIQCIFRRDDSSCQKPLCSNQEYRLAKKRIILT